MALRVEQVVDDGSFRLVGDLDLSSADQLIERLGPAERRQGDIRLDVAGLEFMDSTGIRALIGLCKELDDGRRLVLRSPRGEVARILELVRADTFPNLVIEDDGASP